MTQQFDPTLSNIGAVATVEQELNVEDILPELGNGHGTLTAVPGEELADLLEDVGAISRPSTTPVWRSIRATRLRPGR